MTRDAKPTETRSAEKDTKSGDGNASMMRLLILSSSVPEAKVIKSCAIKGKVVVVESNFETDTMFDIVTNIQTAFTANGGRKFGSIGILEHGRAQEMKLTKRLSLTRHSYRMNTGGVKDFFHELASRYLTKGGRIDFLSCRFSKEGCEGPCRENVLFMLERDTKANFAASYTAFGAPKDASDTANFKLESDAVDTIGMYFTEDIKKWNHQLGSEELVTVYLAHCLFWTLCCLCEICVEALHEV